MRRAPVRRWLFEALLFAAAGVVIVYAGFGSLLAFGPHPLYVAPYDTDFRALELWRIKDQPWVQTVRIHDSWVTVTLPYLDWKPTFRVFRFILAPVVRSDQPPLEVASKQNLPFGSELARTWPELPAEFPKPEEGRQCYWDEYQAGWPFLALRAYGCRVPPRKQDLSDPADLSGIHGGIAVMKSIPLPSGRTLNEHVVVPLLPMPLPFIGNVVFWGLLLWTILRGIPGLLRWRVRSRRRTEGLCVACGYDLRGSPAKCPECGAADVAVSHNGRAERV